MVKEKEMRVFISSDMEGTAGVVHWQETEQEHPNQYQPFSVQMSREVAAACQGAIDAGAQDVVVKDAHDSARNIIFDMLPESVQMIRGWTGDMHSMMKRNSAWKVRRGADDRISYRRSADGKSAVACDESARIQW